MSHESLDQGHVILEWRRNCRSFKQMDNTRIKPKSTNTQGYITLDCATEDVGFGI